MMTPTNATILQPIERIICFGGPTHPVDPQIAITLLLYDMCSFRKYLCLSPQWHRLVLDAMDDYFKRVETSFVNCNYEHLMFKKSYTNSSIIHFCGRKGIRVDRVLVCELLENQAVLNKCLKLSYSYKYASDISNNDNGYGKKKKGGQDTYVADYKLDVVKANANRVVWVHKDE